MNINNTKSIYTQATSDPKINLSTSVHNIFNTKPYEHTFFSITIQKDTYIAFTAYKLQSSTTNQMY